MALFYKNLYNLKLSCHNNNAMKNKCCFHLLYSKRLNHQSYCILWEQRSHLQPLSMDRYNRQPEPHLHQQHPLPLKYRSLQSLLQM